MYGLDDASGVTTTSSLSDESENGLSMDGEFTEGMLFGENNFKDHHYTDDRSSVWRKKYEKSKRKCMCAVIHAFTCEGKELKQELQCLSSAIDDCRQVFEHVCCVLLVLSLSGKLFGGSKSRARK